MKSRLEIGQVPLNFGMSLGSGQGDPAQFLVELAELWRWLGEGRVTTGAPGVGAQDTARLMVEVWEGMLAKWRRDFGLSPEAARQLLAGLQGAARAEEEWPRAAPPEQGSGLADKPQRLDFGWAEVVAAATLDAVRYSAREQGEPRPHTHETLAYLWLVGCRDLGLQFVGTRDLRLRETYFGPACAEGLMSEARWLKARGSVNKPFKNLVDRHPDRVVKIEVPGVTVPGEIGAFGLTRGGYEAARRELQQVGLQERALQRMSDTLRAAPLPLRCPEAWQRDPDEVLARRAGTWTST